MELITKAPKGTVDILPPETAAWAALESVMESEAVLNGFAEIRTPMFEHTDLFLRGVGDTTDIVEKQMYTFNDKGGRSITLRPEGTAGVARAMLENGMYNNGFPIKLFYKFSCFRYERPQKGRLRELHQFGVEVFGAEDYVADAQVISMAKSCFDRLGLKNIEVQLNSIGCPTCREKYRKVLKEYFMQYKDKLCDSCLSRLERNPMRLLDCKSPVCSELAKDAPKILDYICDDCKEHFEGVKSCLDGIGIEYKIMPDLVRGLDYYTRTVFEFVSTDIGSQGAIGGGGRYDGLVEELGGNPTSGLGYALGLDRIMLVMKAQGIDLPTQEPPEIFIIGMDKNARQKAFELTDKLHKCGISADSEICGRGFKPQMKYSNKIKAKFTMVLGGEELSEGKAGLKNMKTGESVKIDIGDNFIDDYITESTKADDLSF